MKRFILSLTAAAVLSMPMAASALEKMDNNQLKSSTGQAGVSIAIDDVVIYQKSVADTTYWDNDGTAGTSTDRSGVQIAYENDMEKVTTINAITNDDNYGTDFFANTFDGIGSDEVGIVGEGEAGEIDGQLDGFTNGISPLSIDVGTCTSLTAGFQHNMNGETYNGNTVDSNYAIAGVVIGIPTVEIATYSTNEIKDINILSDNPYAVNKGKTMISIEKSGDSKMAILGGRLEIAPH